MPQPLRASRSANAMDDGASAGAASQEAAARRSRAGRNEVYFKRSWNRALWQSAAAPMSMVDALWQDPDRLVSQGVMLKDGDRCTVVRLDQGDRPLVLKRYNSKDSVHTAVHLMLRSRAQWGWINGRRLMATNVRTPEPLACLEERYCGVLRLRSYLLTEFVAGKTLREYVAADDPGHPGNPGHAGYTDLPDLAIQFSSIWQTLGQLRVGHGDMKATNFIIDARRRLWLIDLDGMRVYRWSPLLRRERRNDLARFMRNWQEHLDVQAIFRARIGTG